MVRRKKDKDARCKTIARFLQKNADEVKHAWKVYRRLEARNWSAQLLSALAVKIFLSVVRCV